MLFAHRVNGLPGCWVAVMFNHPSAWVATGIDRLRPACRTTPQTSVTWPTQRLSPGRHNGHEPGGNLVATTTRNSFKQALSLPPIMPVCLCAIRACRARIRNY